MKIFLLKAIFCFLLATPALAQQVQIPPMTNQDVLEMTKAGLSASVIADKISSSPCRFDTSVVALTNLKSSGVDDSVLSAMIRCRPTSALHDKPHVWIGGNKEWIARAESTTSVTTNANDTSAVETSRGKATVQTHSEYPDLMRELSDRCQGVVITNNPSEADYAVAIEREHSESGGLVGRLLTQRNRFSVYRARDGNLILSNTTTWLKNVGNDICKSVLQDAAPKRTTDGRN